MTYYQKATETVIDGAAFCSDCEWTREDSQYRPDPGSFRGPVALVRVAAQRHAKAHGHSTSFIRSKVERFGAVDHILRGVTE